MKMKMFLLLNPSQNTICLAIVVQFSLPLACSQYFSSKRNNHEILVRFQDFMSFSEANCLNASSSPDSL